MTYKNEHSKENSQSRRGGNMTYKNEHSKENSQSRRGGNMTYENEKSTARIGENMKTTSKKNSNIKAKADKKVAADKTADKGKKVADDKALTHGKKDERNISEVLKIQEQISQNIFSTLVSKDTFKKDRELLNKVACESFAKIEIAKWIKEQWHFPSSLDKNVADLCEYFLYLEFKRCGYKDFSLDLFWAKFYYLTNTSDKVFKLLDGKIDNEVKDELDLFRNFQTADDWQVLDCCKQCFCQFLSQGAQSLFLSEMQSANTVIESSKASIIEKYFSEFVKLTNDIEKNIMRGDLKKLEDVCRHDENEFLEKILKKCSKDSKKTSKRNTNKSSSNAADNEYGGWEESDNSSKKLSHRDEIAECAQNFVRDWDPQKIYEKLDERVYKQDEAKRNISVQVYNHMLRLADPESKMRKQNSLMVGPTGCGKTEIVRALREIVPIPVIEVCMANISPDGWKGMSLSQHLYLATRDYECPWVLPYGIYFLDEVDKILTHAHGKDSVYCADAQASLLKVLEDGTIIYTGASGGFKMNLKDATIIMAGAFEGMLSDESIHLSSFDKTNKGAGIKCISEQLSYAGFTREFIGRIGNVFKLNKLDDSDLLYILKNINTSVVDSLKTEVERQGYELEITDNALELAAREAAKAGLGVRGLEGILRPALNNILFASYKAKEEQLLLPEEDQIPNVEEYQLTLFEEDIYPYVSEETIKEFKEYLNTFEEFDEPFDIDLYLPCTN